MTINQLRVILMTARLGTISGAAKALGLSQPNASSCIKTIEEEIGYEIFERRSKGIVPTEKGKLFLDHAQRIAEESQSILELANRSRLLRLRVGSFNFTAAEEAFLKICKENREEKTVDFQYRHISPEAGMRLLISREIDIFVGPNFEEHEEFLKKVCDDYRLECIEFGTLPTAVSVRKGHPVLENADLSNTAEMLSKLAQYPFVYYHTLESESENLSSGLARNITSTCRIQVEEKETRFRTVAMTNAFSSGIRQSQAVLDKYGLVAIPLPDITFRVNAFVRNGESTQAEIAHYLQLLQEELTLVYLS